MARSVFAGRDVAITRWRSINYERMLIVKFINCAIQCSPVGASWRNFVWAKPTNTEVHEIGRPFTKGAAEDRSERPGKPGGAQSLGMIRRV